MRYTLVHVVSGAAIALYLACPVLGAAPGPTETPHRVATAAASALGKLYAPGSQLRSWPMRVFVTRDLPKDPLPVLTLSFDHAVLDAKQNS